VAPAVLSYVFVVVRVDGRTGGHATIADQVRRTAARTRRGPTAARYDLDNGTGNLDRRIDVAGGIDRKGEDVVAARTHPERRDINRGIRAVAVSGL